MSCCPTTPDPCRIRLGASALDAPPPNSSALLLFAVEKTPCEEKEEKDISKLVSGIVKCSINRQISYKTVGPNEVREQL